MFKVDVFVPATGPYDRQVFQRKRSRAVSEDGSQSLYFPSPEDIILKKLAWHRASGEATDRQWKDVLGVIKVQSDRLDRAYLEKWAAYLGLPDLLKKAFRESAD